MNNKTLKMKMDTAAILLYATVTFHSIGASLIKGKETTALKNQNRPCGYAMMA